MKKVSIIVPIYNVEKYLRKCLDSLVNQTYQNVEILCINDGSKDNSQLIIDEYENKYPNIHGYIKENGGLSDARNYGIDKASGEYLMFVDSDDYLRNDAIELLMKKADKENSDIVVCDLDYVYEDGTIKKAYQYEFESGSPKENNDLIFITNSACDKLFKKDLFDDYRFPKGMWYEDLASIPTILSKANKISKLDEELYMYFQRQGSIVHKRDDRIFDIYKAINKVKEEILSFKEYQGKQNIIDKFNDYYIIHGADLTTLRISNFDSKRNEYLKRNAELLEKYYPNWYSNHLIKEMGFKKHILFFLLKKRYTKLLLRLLGKKDND